MRILFFFVFILISAFGFAQNFGHGNAIFDDSHIHRVEVTLPADSVDWLYASQNLYQNRYLHANFVFTNGANNQKTTINNVGFRLRGNTSRQADKKSFKVQFDEFVAGQELDGLDEINLKGAHNDPTLMREWLSFYLFRVNGLPAPRVSFIEVYINSNYMGLYVNVEHIDKRFVDDRFGDKTGNLYKCLYGSDLSDPSEVYDNGRYELKTNKAENQRPNLETLIDVLKNSPIGTFRDDVFSIINVENVIRYFAIEALVGHWDGYSYNKNNFYLYFDELQNRFEFIPYDPDNTFGIDWIGIDWAKRDIYDWYNTNDDRLLASRLLGLNEFHKMYSENISMVVNDVFNESHLFPMIESQKQLVRPHVLNDPYYPLDYGFSIDDFDDAFEEQVASHAPYGMKPYIADRAANALNQLDQQAVFTQTFKKAEGQLHQQGNSLIVSDKLLGVPFHLFNISGQILEVGNLKNQNHFNHLISGVYLVSIPSIGLSKKLIVN